VTLHVVGIGADGWPALPEPARALVAAAEVVLGAPRQLGLLPVIAGQRRRAWPSPLREGLPELLAGLAAELDRAAVVALASGDPLLAGIGTTLVDLLGPEKVAVVPAVSSVALARARLGWAAETVEVVRDPATVVRHLAPGRRILVLSPDRTTPARLAPALTERGFGASRFTVLADLGGADESAHRSTAADWSGDAPALHVLAIECLGGPGHGLLAGLPDDAFSDDGQLTRRDLRASALARLAPRPGQLLWDVGAGAGSVAVEWLRAHPSCRAVAVERDPARAARVTRNAEALGVPGLTVVTGAAPDALAGLPDPDAVFVGGGATVPGVLDSCWSALRPGGRLVVHGVTVETEAALAGAYGRRGGELTRISVEHAAPLGGFTGFTPARTVTQWAVTKP
jgi:precorrin-6B C5,15-methyltransferase / cobalt-precorrin-6B C5,C15-methyltransferase